MHYKVSEPRDPLLPHCVWKENVYIFSYSLISDHNGWTALHHASLGGYTQTMKVILDTNLKCTDRIDEEGVCTMFLYLLTLSIVKIAKIS